MRPVPASLVPPPGLKALLLELGDGENGFMGVETQNVTDYLKRLVDCAQGVNMAEGHVPSTTFWLLDDAGALVGMSRLRHRLTPALLADGGHIGYYVRPSQRGKRYGSAILRLTLIEARGLGVDRALLTVDSHNLASVRVIEGNGGSMEDERVDPDGVIYRRYWIDLA
jgi:predicted acetyltransferase